MESKLNDTLNASAMLHLALQKVDGIIATNSDAESLSVKSDFVLSNEDVNSDLQSPSYLKQCSNNFKFTNNGTNLDYGSVKQQASNYKKQDKLNRLLQELKDYSLEDKNEHRDSGTPRKMHHFANENGRGETPIKPSRRYQPSSASNSNGNSTSISAHQQQHSENVDKLTQVVQTQAQHPDKSTNSTADFYRQSPELTGDNLCEPDRNSNFLQHQHHHQQLNPDAPYHDASQAIALDRVAQLESIVAILRNQLLTTDDLFKKALLSKKTLEGANCDLLTVVDKLKIELTHSESRRKLTEEHNGRLDADNDALKNRLLEKETEVSSLRLTLAKIVRSTGYELSENELALLRGKTIASDFIKNKLTKDIYSDGFCKSPKNNAAFYSEPSSRRESVSSALCGRSSPVVPGRPFHSQSAHPSPSPTPPARASHHHHPKQHPVNNGQYSVESSPLTMPRSTSAENMKLNSEHYSPESSIANHHDGTRARSEDKTYEQFNRQFNSKNIYLTMPTNTKAVRQIQESLSGRESQEEFSTNGNRPRYGNDEMRQMSQSLMDEQLGGRAFSTPSSPLATFKSSIHTSNGQPHASSSGVTFAKDDEIIPASLQSSTSELSRNGIAPPRILSDSKPKGFKKIFSRKRSTSSLSGLSDAFSRGGLRATSGPRLGFSNNDKKFQNITLPFSQWDTNLVADWFAVIGLGMYVGECKRWCKNGEHLMRATSAEVEKDLGIRNLLHRKKLRLAVSAMNDEEDQLLKNAGKLDYLWVARWLDDIGLPQYKDAFLDARIDGRVLHYLTVEDLFYLKVTSQLHFASIRSGIRILRENNYNGQCLKRRAIPEEAQEIEWQASEVSLWSSHRVMEWLRSIDLSEYAPNLRGSGVHGALILFESAFNADLFATLLSIPANKTLLRRHISAKFKQLIGDELSKVKRDFECQPNYSPMIPGSKVKAHKKGHFTLRKKRSDFELTDYVCPLSPVISTRNKIINLINDAKSSPQASEQMYQSMTSSGEWKSLLRPSSISSNSSIPEPAPADVPTSPISTSSNQNESFSSVDRSVDNAQTTKSDSELNELSGKQLKKESVIT